MRTKDAFAVVLQAVTGVNSKPLIMDSPKTTEVWTWFSGFRYHKFEGRFEFRITPELQPYLLALQERFTRFRLKNVCAFRSAHTWRLYENLKQWEAIGSWFVGLDELKGRLGVAGKYEIWSKFKVWVIDPAVKEINAKSDLYVNWEAEKRGRRIHALLFFVNARPEKDVIDIGGSKENFTRALMRCGVRKRTALDYTRRLEAQNMLSEAAALLPDLERSWEKTGKETLICYVVGALRKKYLQKPPNPGVTDHEIPAVSFARTFQSQCGVCLDDAMEITRLLEAQGRLAEAAAILPEVKKSWKKTGEKNLADHVLDGLKQKFLQHSEDGK